MINRLFVSTRTIYRDVENLSMAGIPVYTSKGKNGGRARTLEEAEKMLLEYFPTLERWKSKGE